MQVEKKSILHVSLDLIVVSPKGHLHEVKHDCNLTSSGGKPTIFMQKREKICKVLCNGLHSFLPIAIFEP